MRLERAFEVACIKKKREPGSPDTANSPHFSSHSTGALPAPLWPIAPPLPAEPPQTVTFGFCEQSESSQSMNLSLSLSTLSEQDALVFSADPPPEPAVPEPPEPPAPPAPLELEEERLGLRRVSQHRMGRCARGRDDQQRAGPAPRRSAARGVEKATAAGRFHSRSYMLLGEADGAVGGAGAGEGATWSSLLAFKALSSVGVRRLHLPFSPPALSESGLFRATVRCEAISFKAQVTRKHNPLRLNRLGVLFAFGRRALRGCPAARRWR
jgi:hypothetical protein